MSQWLEYTDLKADKGKSGRTNNLGDIKYQNLVTLFFEYTVPILHTRIKITLIFLKI